MLDERNVLIVDSNQKVLETLKRPLEDEGYKIDTATDGRSTIKIVEQGKFAVVILNINLPDINGIEVLKKIKNISPGTEVVVVTRRPSARALMEGAYAYIIKPPDIDEVKAVIRKVLEIREIISEKDLLIDDLKRSTQELEQKRDELIRAEKLSFAGRMAASVAHEIRNPLNIIGMSIEQLHSELKKKDPRREYTKIITENIERVDELIKGFTDIARPPKLKLRMGNINDTINEVAKLMEPRFKDGKVKVIKELESALPKIKIDKESITKAFSNMLINACEALPKTGGKLWVTTKKDSNYIEIKFRNRGKPIPKENLIKIFDPFFSGKRGGIGLGLSIVYSIVVSHGGSIDVESNRKTGTVFIIRFPLQG